MARNKMIFKTVLVQTQITEGRAVIAQFLRVIYADDGSEIARTNPHTVTLLPDADPASMLALVNADITTRPGMRWNPIEAADWSRVAGYCQIEHTPVVKTAYEAFKQSQTVTSRDVAKEQ
jgi:hypothetical protein